MPPVTGIAGFTAAFNDARHDGTQQGALVSYQELRNALSALQAPDQQVSRDDARQAAAKLVEYPRLTNAAKREAYAFLEWVGRGKPIDAATKEAIKAEFTLRAVSPNEPLDVPGVALAPDADLVPASVRAEAANMLMFGGRFVSSTVMKSNLAGKQVFLVHHQHLGANAAVETVQVFSLEGARLARGAVWSRTTPFAWSSRS